MLSWIERVVPQPPAIPPTPVVVETAVKPELKTKVSKSGRSRKKLLEKKSSRPTSEKKDSVVTPDPVPTTESSGRGVLTWLSEGFVKVVPQPSPRPVCQKDSKTSDAANQTDAQNVVEDEKKEATGTPDPASTAEGSGRGVLTWLSEGLEKVVPQPTEPGIILHRDSKTSDAANQTEVQKNVEDEGKLDPSKPSGVEGEVQPSSDTNAPETAGTKTVFNRLMEEFEKMIPQPDVAKKAEEATPVTQTADQGNPKDEAQKENSPNKSLPKDHDNLTISLFGGDGGSFFKMLMRGLEKAIPQPVTKEKPVEQPVEAVSQEPEQERSKGA